jgi:hypothetical protein
MNRNLKMTSTLRALGLATIAVAIGSCGGNSNKNSPAPGPAAPPAAAPAQKEVVKPAWKVSLQIACTGTDDSCKPHSFSVDASGNYRNDPAPGGQALTGQITANELADVTAKVNAFGGLSTAAASAETCQAVTDATSATAGDTLTLTQQSTDKVLLLAKDGQSCYEVGNASAVDSLHQAMNALEDNYNVCTASVALLKQDYTTIQSCSTDKDCAYYNADLSGDAPAFDLATSGPVYTDNIGGFCSLIPPLVVANGSKLDASSDTLTKAFQATIDACQGRQQPATCLITTVDASFAPTCVQNVCTINSGPAITQIAPPTGSAHLR